MCGRFALGVPRRTLAEHFCMAAVPKAPLRYNIAPSQLVEAVIDDPERGGFGMRLFRWGLVPFWAKDKSIGARLINARSETAAEKPAFRAAMRYRRCLLPASGFYEWKGGGRGKTPYFFSPAKGGVMALAGLWEQYESPDGEIILSCAVLTREADATVGAVHHRMPVIVAPEDYKAWVDRHATDPGAPASFFRREPPALSCWPVGTQVNDPTVDNASLTAPLSERGDLFS